ncbi:MAG: MFS transporter [Bacteroidota bacterium]
MKRNKDKQDAFAVLRIPEFRLFVSGRFLLTFAIQMQSVIIGWQVYEITKNVLALGFIGLAEAIPFLTSAIFAGLAADRFNRKKIMMVATFVYLMGAIALLILSYHFSDMYFRYGVMPVYSIIFVTAVARSFFYPAQSALMAQLVPRDLYHNSSTWNSTVFHIAAVSGPAVGGLIYGFAGIHAAYISVITGVVLAFAIFSRIKNKPLPKITKNETLFESLLAGIRFVFSNQIILGAISLDMFAVLFGGAVAMLPAFALEVLHVGPQGLGFLRAAPAVGAVIMAFILAYNPPLKSAGRNLLYSIAGFGLCIICFAISRNFYLSFALLALSGMFDNVSVIIRQTILQLYIPDEMRGRVMAVNSIFIGSSNEIGSFESGLAARLLGLIPSVIFGGSMTMLIVGTTAKIAPNLRKLSIKRNQSAHTEIETAEMGDL